MSNKRKFLKICSICAILATTLCAKTLVNGISVLVNNEPITLYEIHKMSQQMKIPLDEALKNLVEKRLEDSQIKKLGIKANSFEVTQQIDDIAKKNGMTSFELMKFIDSKGISEKEYRRNIAEGIKNRKLFKRIFRKKVPAPSKSEIEAYYNSHQEEFTKSTTFNVTAYKASTYTALQEVKESPMSVVAGVTLDQEIITSLDVDKKTSYYLNQTPDGKFTPILKRKNGYIMYLLDSKPNSTSMSIEDAKPMILQKLAKEYESEIVKNYFDKLKASADIVFVRKP